jgi:hypothetical protein
MAFSFNICIHIFFIYMGLLLLSMWFSTKILGSVSFKQHLLTHCSDDADILVFLLCPRDEEAGGGEGILIYPCPSVCPSRYRYMVCPAITSYSLGATALICCTMFIHIMEVCMSTGFCFLQIFSKWQVVGLSHFVRLSGYRYMVCPAISSYSFGATALIFCMMFMHIMEVCMSTGFWWSVRGHTSFLVLSNFLKSHRFFACVRHVVSSCAILQ